MTAIRKAGVVGAGTMGRGIARSAAASGVAVVPVDVAAAAMPHGPSAIATGLDRPVRKDRISAATETAALKPEILRRAVAPAKPAVLPATSTSSISITTLAAVPLGRRTGRGFHHYGQRG